MWLVRFLGVYNLLLSFRRLLWLNFLQFLITCALLKTVLFNRFLLRKSDQFFIYHFYSFFVGCARGATSLVRSWSILCLGWKLHYLLRSRLVKLVDTSAIHVFLEDYLSAGGFFSGFWLLLVWLRLLRNYFEVTTVGGRFMRAGFSWYEAQMLLWGLLRVRRDVLVFFFNKYSLSFELLGRISRLGCLGININSHLLINHLHLKTLTRHYLLLMERVSWLRSK